MNHFKLWRRLLVALLLGLAAPWLSAIGLVPMTSTALSSPVFVGHAGDGIAIGCSSSSGAGIIKVLQPGASTPTRVPRHPHRELVAGGEQGLLGLAFHPLYEANGRFFVYYTRTATARWSSPSTGCPRNPNVANTAETVLLTIPHPTNANHNGGMLAFGPDGYPLHRRRRRRRRQRSAEQRPEHRTCCSARSCASTSITRSGGGHAVRRRRPTTRSSARRRARRDLRVSACAIPGASASTG